ncbi:LON peptidase substrate-binding domain-containing protein [Nitratireductor luteus]|uniref:LON peptidase substrate-binding domain-containing protein n=1 Tax=Nitratireductor luteus TaxID=2976980 RepID=UPI00223F0F05|nr:LON peptidase substrate-binding domain-containing protein [Nitratireductor luteus]
MKAGNAEYSDTADLPQVVPVFPLAGALLLPGGRLPLNIFEPRYVAMTDHALADQRLIGMIQPSLERPGKMVAARAGEPPLCTVGCLGRLVSLSETGDGRYLVSLQGICRFTCVEEIATDRPFRLCRIEPFARDLRKDTTAEAIDRKGLIDALRAYLAAHDLEADWQSVSRAENGPLVNALSMMAPYGPAEKQALLEAPDVKARAETLVALTEMVTARHAGDNGRNLQ